MCSDNLPSVLAHLYLYTGDRKPDTHEGPSEHDSAVTGYDTSVQGGWNPCTEEARYVIVVRDEGVGMRSVGTKE